MLNEFLVRVGTFCILIGLGILVLFVASDASGQANFDYLFWAVLAVTLGILLRRRKPPSEPSGRFSTLRGIRDRSRQNKDHR